MEDGYKMRPVSAFLLPMLMLTVRSTELGQATLNAWENYLRAADHKAKTGALDASRFPIVDRVPQAGERARRGETWITPFGQNGTVFVPDGVIYDSVGATFISNASLREALSVVRSYAQYPEFSAPLVLESECIGREPSRDLFSMLVSSFARFEEKDGGSYVEVEPIALSRDIPSPVRWLVTPIVVRASRDALTNSLQQTRNAVSAATISVGRNSSARKRRTDLGGMSS